MNDDQYTEPVLAKDILPGDMFFVECAFHPKFFAIAITSRRDPEMPFHWLIGVLWPRWNNCYKELQFTKNDPVLRIK
jgi:hypothetical protein